MYKHHYMPCILLSATRYDKKYRFLQSEPFIVQFSSGFLTRGFFCSLVVHLLHQLDDTEHFSNVTTFVYQINHTYVCMINILSWNSSKTLKEMLTYLIIQSYFLSCVNTFIMFAENWASILKSSSMSFYVVMVEVTMIILQLWTFLQVHYQVRWCVVGNVLTQQS